MALEMTILVVAAVITTTTATAAEAQAARPADGRWRRRGRRCGTNKPTHRRALHTVFRRQ